MFACNGHKVNGVCYRMEVLVCMEKKNKRFVFHSVIVGQIARAQFKIANPNKVLC